MIHCSEIKEKINEIKKEDPALSYILNLFCEQADTIDKNGDAASAISSFLAFVPQQKELKIQCYNELYNKLDQLLFRNHSSTRMDEFVQECYSYIKNFYSIKQLPLYYQSVKEFLTRKVTDQDIKEAINEFIDANSEEKDKENVYSMLMLRVIDFNIGNISKEEFIKILKSPTIFEDNFIPVHEIAADTTMAAQIVIPPVATPIKKRLSEESRKSHYSYFVSQSKKEPELSGKQEARYMEYTDSSKEEGKMKFFNAGKDWIRNCKNIRLIIDNEDKTFLEWINSFKPSFRSREHLFKIESSLDDIYASMAKMTDNEKDRFMIDFIAAMKVHLANKLELTELTQEQTNFIENSIDLISQHAFDYKMQAELCAALIKSSLAIAENGENHFIIVDIELESKAIILIEKGFFILKDDNIVSYTGKTKFEPNVDGVKATNFGRNFSATDKILYERLIELAVIPERENILLTLDSFLKELKNNPEQETKAEINSNKYWLKLKLRKMQNALLPINEDKSISFITQRDLVLEQIENPKSLQDLKALDDFFSLLYTDISGNTISYPPYQSIEAQVAAIKTGLTSDSISERDLLTAQEKIRDFNHYIFPQKSVAIETLIDSLEAFRKKHFEPKPYLRIEDQKPVPLQDDSAAALGKKEKGFKQDQSISKQRSMPVVYSEARSSVIKRRHDSVSMFSPERTTIKGNGVSYKPPISTPHQKRKTREEVPSSDLYMFRSFMR